MKGANSTIVLGATGLVGSALCAHLSRAGFHVTRVNSSNYDEFKGASADVLINCNGNAYRFKANQDPRADFDANVLSVENSLFHFKVGLYVYISTVDVYSNLADPACNLESSPIDLKLLDTYGFHKWLSERLVEKFSARSVILRAGTVIGRGLKKGPIYDLLHDRELYMSPDSELSLVDTELISKAILDVIKHAPQRLVLNLTGTGSVTLRNLAAKLHIPLRACAQKELIVHRYQINNKELRKRMPVASSEDIALSFMRQFKNSDPGQDQGSLCTNG
jgi:dTDP-4-dehydrorhamnose reductase